MNSDKLAEAESYTCSDLSQAVKLRATEFDLERFPPITIYSMFKQIVEEKPHARALAFKPKSNPTGSEWTYLTFLQYFDICKQTAKSFIKLGLNANECVSIIGFNAPEWFYSILGAIFAGGVGCGVYTTNSAEACEYVLTDSKSRIVVVENKQQLDKIIKSKDRTNLIKIIQYSGKVENDYNGLVIEWEQFMEFGKNVGDSELKSRINGLAPNKCATLIYTSGTTGNPKAVMLSHDCITYTYRYILIDLARMQPFNERIVSYLPLSHIAGQMLDIYASIGIGALVYFAQPDALRGSLSKTMKEARPTFFLGVPRVWEKMQEAVQKKLNGLSGLKLKLVEWARSAASAHINYCFSGGNYGGYNLFYNLAWYLVLGKIHQELGLDQCKNCYSGAAPIMKDTLEFFVSLGIPLVEVYGMSETTGPHTNGTYYSNKIGSIGPDRGVNKTKILKLDTEIDGDEKSGELLVYGRHVFMGYLNDPAKTAASFHSSGYLHTGDTIREDENGFLFISGRIKELIITAGGENIAPVPIEDNLKSELPQLISNCMVVGDKRKYLTVLVTLKTVINLDTMLPTDELAPECIEYLKSIGSDSVKLSQIIKNNDKYVHEQIEKAIKRVNDKSTSNACRLQKFTVLPKDFSLPNGELGPTLKLRRQVVNQLYSEQINKMYQD